MVGAAENGSISSRSKLTGKLSELSLDDIIKLLGAGTVLCYGVGLIVVQLYLLSVGVSDFGLVRTRFILTGVLALLLLVVLIYLGLTGVVAASYARSIWKDNDAEGGRSVSRRAQSVFPVLIFVLGLGLGFTVLNQAGFRYRSPAGDYLLFSIMPVLSVFLGITTLAVFGHFGEQRRRRGLYKSTLMIVLSELTIMVVIFAFVYFDFFANSVFPAIPEQFGGGRPRSVEIVFSGESAAWAHANSLISDGGTQSKPLSLLWETDSLLILRDPADSDSVIQVNRDDVRVIIIDPPDPSLGGILYREENESPIATPDQP